MSHWRLTTGTLPPVARGREVGVDPLLHVAHERVSLAEDQVVPHAERVRVHPEHGAGLGRGLAVRDLRGRAVHDDRVHAQPGRGARPRGLGPRGVVEKERVGELVGQERRLLPGAVQRGEALGDGEEPESSAVV